MGYFDRKKELIRDKAREIYSMQNGGSDFDNLSDEEIKYLYSEAEAVIDNEDGFCCLDDEDDEDFDRKYLQYKEEL